MKPTTYLLPVAVLLTLEASFAQKLNVPKAIPKRPAHVLARHVPAPAPRPMIPLAASTGGKSPLADTLRTKLTEQRTQPTSTSAGVANNVPAHSLNVPELAHVANPNLMNELRVKPYLMPLDKAAVRGSYPLGISVTKTTHIIFPAKIREFDAGTDYVLAQVPESASNVLRVKANGQTAFCAPGSTAETNMTIITDDGNLYSFLVRHQADPEVLNINMANNHKADEQSAQTQGISRATVVPVMLTNGQRTSHINRTADLSTAELRRDCEQINDRKGFIRRVGAKKQGISCHLKGLYVNGKVMYLQLAFQNKTDIDYDVDFVKFYLRDRDVFKRMAAQEVELTPYTTYPTEVRTLNANTEQKAIFALPLRTLADDKVLEVDLYERDGGRHLRFSVDGKIILKAHSPEDQ